MANTSNASQSTIVADQFHAWQAIMERKQALYAITTLVGQAAAVGKPGIVSSDG